MIECLVMSLPETARSEDQVAVSPQDHPVVALIRDRVRAGSKPGARADDARLALAIEGGGLRGVVSAGMDAALEDLQLLDAFDEIYGASAGSFNAAYLLSERARLGATIYYEDVNNRHFVNVRRALRGPILDLDFMLNEVAETVKPIAWDRVVDSLIPLHVVSFSVDDRATVLLPFSDKHGLKLALKASSSIPWVAGQPVEIDGHPYWDASFYDGSIPTALAHARGATHVLSLLTRPTGYLRGRPNPLEKYFIARHVKKYGGAELADLYLARAEQYAVAINSLKEASLFPEGPTYALGVALGADIPRVSQLETSHAALYAAAVEGYRVLRSIFDQSEFLVAHELRGFHV
jgi:predicted patatin/cPLA2 family phospholipase